MDVKEELNKLFPSDMRKYNRFYHPEWKKDRKTTQINVNITARMKRGIDLLIKAEKFLNKSEFIRFLIIKYFDEISR